MESTRHCERCGCDSPVRPYLSLSQGYKKTYKGTIDKCPSLIAWGWNEVRPSNLNYKQWLASCRNCSHHDRILDHDNAFSYEDYCDMGFDDYGEKTVFIVDTELSKKTVDTYWTCPICGEKVKLFSENQ